MPRPLRKFLPNVPYHVVQRGNYREYILSNEEDKSVYIHLFEEYTLKYKVKIYAWCLMDNHVHFIVEAKDTTSISHLFKCVSMMYSRHYKRIKKANGQLWQGRFFACELDENHLYEAVRYVELNPLRAELVNTIEDYEWSSALARLRGINYLPLDNLNKYFHIKDWRKYLEEGVNEELLKRIRPNYKIGRPKRARHV